MAPKPQPPVSPFNRHDILLAIAVVSQLLAVGWFMSGLSSQVTKHEDTLRTLAAQPDRLARVEERLEALKTNTADRLEAVKSSLGEIKDLLRRSPMRLGASEIPLASPPPSEKPAVRLSPPVRRIAHRSRCGQWDVFCPLAH